MRRISLRLFSAFNALTCSSRDSSWASNRQREPLTCHASFVSCLYSITDRSESVRYVVYLGFFVRKANISRQDFQPYRHLRNASQNTSRPVRASNVPISHLTTTFLRASKAENCINQPYILRIPIPGRHGPILPATTTTIQSPKPPILPIHLPGSRFRAFHSFTSTIRLWPTIRLTVLPKLRWVRGSTELWRPGCEWAHGRARGIEDRMDSGVWDGGI